MKIVYRFIFSIHILYALPVDISDIQHLIQLKIQENWDELVDELEPCQMLACFKKKGLLMQDDERYVLKFDERRERVEALLKVLLKKSNSRMLPYFVQLLKQMDKTDIAEKFDCGDMTRVHQEAGIEDLSYCYNVVTE
jgi:hypothetical protein